VNGAVHASTACQPAVCSIDNRIDLLLGNVAFHQFDDSVVDGDFHSCLHTLGGLE
jgi:hypothetical protein